MPQRGPGSQESGVWWSGAVWRTFWCFVVWLAFAGLGGVDVIVGVVAAALAAAASLAVQPPRERRGSWSGRLRFAGRFLVQSVYGGIDVAWRAFHPRMPLAPGFVHYAYLGEPTRECDVFCAVSSLLPGTLPVGRDAGGLLIHCLDTAQPVQAQMRSDELLFGAAVGRGRRHG